MEINWRSWLRSLLIRLELLPKELLTKREVTVLLQAVGLEPDQAISTARGEHQGLLERVKNLRSNAAKIDAQARAEFEQVVTAAREARAKKLGQVTEMEGKAEVTSAHASVLGAVLDKLH